MNIESSNINRTKEIQAAVKNSVNNNDSSVKFADELKNNVKSEETKELKTEEKNKIENTEEPDTETNQDSVNNSEEPESEGESNENLLDDAIDGLNSVVEEFNQSEDKLSGLIKNEENFADNNNVINNDFNIQENKDIMPQMNPNMNFSGNGQPFSSFMNNDTEQNKNSNGVLGASAQDLAEEAAILSTMAENIAIANKNQALRDARTVTNEDGIKRVHSQTGITIENIVKYDTLIMNQADVEVFASLVERGEINLNNLAPKAAERGIHISKTLADMIAKSMETNQPVRINFDNDISVIIRISRDGKITADFLPSSQVAEAYLKENLPLLKQRFDENNIEYDSLNQKERRNPNKESNKKKGRDNE